MFINNPYAQAGWYNPQNSYSINNTPWCQTSRHPPTFGVLPSPDNRPASVVTFEFGLNPDVFTSMVTGPKKMKYFEIRTNDDTTVFSKPGERFAMIQWSSHPTIEAAGVLPRQRTKDFLKLSSDQRHDHRIMVIAGRNYAWIPRESGIYLFSAGPYPPVEFARLTLTSDNTRLVVELTSEAFQAGLFEPCIISAVLLFSARSID